MWFRSYPAWRAKCQLWDALTNEDIIEFVAETVFPLRRKQCTVHYISGYCELLFNA